MNWISKLHSLKTWQRYSQSGEESYIEHILANIKQINKHLVELGAWDGFYLSNTRHFIELGYTANLIDGDNRGNKEVHQAIITKENVNEILASLNTPDSFDLLNIDLDGNDYYILDEILSKYRPSLIVAEFNPIFSPNQSFAIQYNPNHVWQNNDYYGFSFAAGVKLGSKHGYTCIFQNANLNMYFVCNEVLSESLGVSLEELANHIPLVTYKSEHYHPASNRIDWAQIY